MGEIKIAEYNRVKFFKNNELKHARVYIPTTILLEWGNLQESLSVDVFYNVKTKDMIVRRKTKGVKK